MNLNQLFGGGGSGVCMKLLCLLKGSHGTWPVFAYVLQLLRLGCTFAARTREYQARSAGNMGCTYKLEGL